MFVSNYVALNLKWSNLFCINIPQLVDPGLPKALSASLHAFFWIIAFSWKSPFNRNLVMLWLLLQISQQDTTVATGQAHKEWSSNRLCMDEPCCKTACMICMITLCSFLQEIKYIARTMKRLYYVLCSFWGFGLETLLIMYSCFFNND